MTLSSNYRFSQSMDKRFLLFQSLGQKKNRNKGFSEIIVTTPTLHHQSRNSENCGKGIQHLGKKKQQQQVSTRFIEKVIHKNIYTLDFFNNSSNTENQIINITTAKTKLIKKRFFQQFKELHSENGCYIQSLQQLRKKYQQQTTPQNRKLTKNTSIVHIRDSQFECQNAGKDMKLNYSRNRVDIGGFNKQSSLISLEEETKRKLTNNSLSFHIFNSKPNFHHKYGHQANSYIDIQMRGLKRNKQAFRKEALRCAQIEKDCLKIQKDKDIQSQINTFALYSQNMKTRLDKNKHKIKKIGEIQL